LAGLATHILDRQQHLLAVLAHAEHDQQHDRGGLVQTVAGLYGFLKSTPPAKLRVPGAPAAPG
jgi:hypothetical protein